MSHSMEIAILKNCSIESHGSVNRKEYPQMI